MSTFIVDSNEDSWQSAMGLEANSAYVIVPDPSSRWTINRNNAHRMTYEGIDTRTTETPVGPFNLRLGSLTVLAWHHQPNGNHSAEVFCFEKGQQNALIRIGSHGGSLHFICADKRGTYGDNSGVCKVKVEKDDGHGGRIRVALPITAKRGSSTWVISQAGGIECHIKYTVGSGSGSKKYNSGLVVEYRNGTTDSRQATKTIGRPFTGTRSGTAQIPVASLPASKLGDIRNVYVTHNVSSSISTVRDHLRNWLEIIDEADKEYRKLKNNELVKDAVKLILV